MRYELPRYIEEEAKIAGPLTIKQFFIFLGGGIACALYFYFLKTQVAVMLSFITLIILIVVVFGRYKGRPVYALIGSIVRYVWNPHTYVWEREQVKVQDVYRETRKTAEVKRDEAPKQKVVTSEQLSELAKKLDEK